MYELYRQDGARPWLIGRDGREVFSFVEDDAHFAWEVVQRLNDPSLIGEES